MVLQMREDRTDDTGATVLRKGQRVDAKPTGRVGYYQVRGDGPPYRVPVSVLEPVDDLDLPDPEPLAVTVPPALLDKDPHAWPFAVTALATLGFALLMF